MNYVAAPRRASLSRSHHRRRGGIRRRAGRGLGACARGARGRSAQARRRRRARHGGGGNSRARLPIDDLSIIGFTAIPRRLADDFAPHPRNRRCRHRRAPGCPRHHRQPGLHPPGGAPGARPRAGDPDSRLRVAVGLGLAARARARHARLCRLRARDPAVRAGDACAARRPALHLRRPSADRASRRSCARTPTKRGGAAPIRRLLLVLPGSRSSEIRRLLAIFGAAIAERRGAGRADGAGTADAAASCFAACAKASPAGPVTPRIVVEPEEKWAAFRTARAALAASGTVTLELALAGVPTVAAYRVPLIEEVIARLAGLRARLTSVILANLVIGENVVPEFLQRDCTPQRLADALVPLLSDTPERSRQIEAFGRLDRIMAIDARAERQGRRDCSRHRTAWPPRSCRRTLQPTLSLLPARLPMPEPSCYPKRS